MRLRNKRALAVIFLVLFATLIFSATAFADNGEEYVSNMYASFWALVPPIIAIGLALITKEVYSSLFVGIIAGALFYSNFNVEMAFSTMLNDGFIASLADSWNVGILIFLVLLGIIVILMNKAGGSAAYGRWASARIKSRNGALAATFGLGVLIFVDDYFNCLTVGSVMRPVTDKFGISRAKLAYLIDATAAPICMIAPISSWAAAVAGVVEGGDANGIDLFIRAIPYNFYSLLTILTIILMIVLKFDFGPMVKHEKNALKGDLYTTEERPYQNVAEETVSSKGKVIDLVLPVVVLVITCILGMVYTGGFFAGESFINSFANCDASVGLPLGAMITLLLMLVFYVPRKVLTFKEFTGAIPEGFKAMVPAILILTFAWTLSSMTGLLGADVYVASLLMGSAASLQAMLPAIIFLVAVGLSFATGTSWGTFGILIPIITGILDITNPLFIISISACLAGAVCGDHCSPISDTTIMASSGAQCDHINHVSTQMPYAMFVAGVSFICYILAGIIQNVFIMLPLALVLMTAAIFLMRAIFGNKTA